MNSGRKPTVSDDEILDVFREASDPVLKTAEVSSEIGIGHRGTLARLERLADDGNLKRKSVGPGFVWWLPAQN